MKHTAKTLFMSLFMLNGATLAQDFNVEMVAYKDCHPSLKSLDFVNKPQVCSMSSQAMTFMLKGKNIAVIDDKSLKLSKLEVNGEDVRFNRKGDETFEFGSFPKIDESGDYAIFDIELKSAPYGYIGSASLAGTVDIMTSKRAVKEQNKGLQLDKPFSIQVGPLTLSNQPKPVPSESEKGGLIDEAGQALAKGLQTAFMGQDSDSLLIYVNGEHDSLISLEVFENGEKLNQGWYTTSGEERRRSFDKPKGATIDITLKYWDGLQKVTVPIKR
jgi:hypothetical protein